VPGLRAASTISSRQSHQRLVQASPRGGLGPGRPLPTFSHDRESPHEPTTSTCASLRPAHAKSARTCFSTVITRSTATNRQKPPKRPFAASSPTSNAISRNPPPTDTANRLMEHMSATAWPRLATDAASVPKAWPLSPRHVHRDLPRYPSPRALEYPRKNITLKGRDEIIAGRVMHEIPRAPGILKTPWA